MPLITTMGRAVRYAVTGSIDGIGIEPVSGTTPVGNATGVCEQLSVVADEDENAFIAALPADAFPPLPDSGWLEEGDIYSYGGECVIVRQSHNRTIYAPSETPALFIVYREDAGSVLDWVAGESVVVGTRRIYNGTLYTCIQAHVTQADWTPPEVPALWRVVQQAGDEWAAYVDYAVDDIVTYNGTEYECIQAHQSLPNWTPDVTPSLWQPVSSGGEEWQPWTAYTIGDIVTYNGAEYECRQSHTSQPGWEPDRVPALWLPL